MNRIASIDRPQPVKLTVEQFELLDGSGAFDTYRKTELIEGAMYAMQGQFRPHTFAANELMFRLRMKLQEMGSNLMPLIEGTVRMPPFSAPQPDIAVTADPKGPGYIPLNSMALVVEVSDSSASFDLNKKKALYARHAIPEYWVLEIRTSTLHQFWLPARSAYQQHRALSIGELIESVTIPGLVVESDGLI